MRPARHKKGLHSALVGIALLFLSACEVPRSPEELTDRLIDAAMTGSEQALSPLLAPESAAQGLSARALRLKYQGFSFRASPNPRNLTSSTSETEKSLWSFEVAISGTERYTPAAQLQIECLKTPERRCQLTGFSEIPWTLPELT
ncbi:MAG: hypothetical protein KGQ59_11055, partial [Bdellovibrionales bacterium]|nr:hypothetical protein [Bdellovibrionales bacterium]